MLLLPPFIFVWFILDAIAPVAKSMKHRVSRKMIRQMPSDALGNRLELERVQDGVTVAQWGQIVYWDH